MDRLVAFAAMVAMLVGLCYGEDVASPRLFYPAANATVSLTTMNTMLTYGAVIFPTAILILGALAIMSIFGFGDSKNDHFKRSMKNGADTLVQLASNLDKLPDFVNYISKTINRKK